MNLLNPYIMAAAGGATDPSFGNVSLLLHFDGTDASTTFTDVKGKTVTPTGNAQIDTAQSKYGGASGLFDASGDYLTVAASADFDFGTSAFTVEWWFRFNSTSTYQYFFDIGSNGTFVRIQNGNALLIYASGGQVINTSISQLSTGQWYHFALTRSGNTWNFWVDGTSVASASYSGSAGSSGSALTIGDYGGHGAGFAINGWMDDFRITKGVARYTATFTPPAAAFPNG